VNRLKTAPRRLAALVLVALAAGAIAAHADSAPRPPAPRATVATSPPPALAMPAIGTFAAACRPVKKPPAAAATPPSQALLDAFAILRRERRPEDALPADALKALQRRNLAPVSPESARLLRTGPGGGQAWVVPVPDVTRTAFPFDCAPNGKRGPREGLAVVAVKRAAPGGGGALDDLVRGRAPVWVDSCAGANGDMLGVSGIVPNGVPAVFLTAPDGTAIRADVKDNGYEFLLPNQRPYEQRYVVWTGGDGTPHVQPIVTFAAMPARACRSSARLAQTVARVSPDGFPPCGAPLLIANKFVLPVPRRASRALRLRRQVASISYVARCTGLAPFAPGGVAAPGRPGPAPPVAVLPARPAPAPSAVPARPVAPSAVPAPPVPAPATPAPAPRRKHR
jgi:hypothetical protein